MFRNFFDSVINQLLLLRPWKALGVSYFLLFTISFPLYVSEYFVEYVKC